ncbi:T9SS type A sorting domain-containing protein [Hymenobacter armeniacus]|uniref:T9SS type A sorting domain-containing protein n=1 Tax=Hymenobacter armeniacus TaxID=2771358 RepID=A0ABR8JZ56_9BACT|nr:T9SS type A sorting domain-containing protein [Hymenobacter armeniacus]MBD2724173.1 T9SS type A sorting domain-containing protein [Hymenobacter armeniacus]
MKKLLPGLLVLLLVGSLRALAQPSTWTFVQPATDINAVMDVATDAAGNAYITGRFTGSTQVGTTTIASARPGMCLFVAKLSPAGQVLRVTKLEGATDVIPYAIAADAAGNTFLTGAFFGTLTYNGGQQTTGRLPLPFEVGGYNILLVKCDPHGRVSWVRQADGGSSGTYGNSYGADVAVDQQGNSYISGRVNGPNVTFGTLAFGARRNQGFLASYNRQGQLRWARVLQASPIQTPGISESAAGGVALDNAGHCYISGTGVGGWELDGIALSNLTGTLYLARFDAGTGHLDWAQTTPGTGDGHALATDAQGDVYLGGRFAGTATFGPRMLTSAGSDDGFVARYDPDGSLDWAVAIGGVNYDVVSALAVDARTRSCYASGMMNFTSQGTNQSFLARLSPSGRMQQQVLVGGPGTSSGAGLALDARANVYTTGVFTGSCLFGGIGLTSPFTESYLARYGSRPGGHGCGGDDDDDDNARADLFPNPAQHQFTLRHRGAAGASQATLYNLQGRAVATQPLPAAAAEVRFDTSALPAGLYTLRLLGPHGPGPAYSVQVQH